MPRLYRRGHVWYADWCEGGRRRRQSISSDRAEAQAFLARILLDAKNEPLKPGFSHLATWGDVWTHFRQNYSFAHHRPATRELHGHCWKHLGPMFRSMRLSDTTAYTVENYQASRRFMGAGPRTVNIEVALLKQLAYTARKLGWLGGDGPLLVKALPEGPGRVRWLTIPEITRLLGVCPDWLSRVVRFALNTGARRGEIASLTWAGVNWDQGLIVLERTKTGERRSIPMNAGARAALHQAPRSIHHERCFTDGHGLPLCPSRLTSAFRAISRRAGLANVHFHDLRHTAASLLMQQGVGIGVIREILGHKDLRMTVRYAHLAPELARAGLNKLDLLDFSTSQIFDFRA